MQLQISFILKVFAELFDPVIDERHGGYPKNAVHPTDLDSSKLKGGQFDEKYVLSSRVRTGRSIRGFSLPPACTRAERREVEKVHQYLWYLLYLQTFGKLSQSLLRSIIILQIVTKALNNLSGELSGKYYPLSKMTDAEQEQLINVSKSVIHNYMHA